MENQTHEQRIREALNFLETQSKKSKINYAATAKRFGLERTTLARRYKGQTRSKIEATSSILRQLSDSQEEVLIKYINKLTDRGFPPTPQILKNLAESIAHTHLGRNWTARFYHRHSTKLTSIYLHAIDHKRKIADNSRYFQHFFDLVCVYLYACDLDAILIILAMSKSRAIQYQS